MADKKLKIHITNDPVYMENGLTVHFRDGGPCWFVDPGLPPQAQNIVEYVRTHKLEPAGILATGTCGNCSNIGLLGGLHLGKYGPQRSKNHSQRILTGPLRPHMVSGTLGVSILYGGQWL